MRSFTLPIRALFAASCLLGLAVMPAQAGTTVKYPKAEPNFTLEIPDGWTFEEEDGDLHELTFKPDTGDFEIKILSLGDKLGDLKTALDKVVKSTMENPKFTEPTHTDATEVKTDSGMAVAISSAKCKIDGQQIIYSFATFAPTTGNTCELAAYATSEADSTKAENAAEKILNSVKPVK